MADELKHEKRATGITLDSVVPWGRSLDEYARMFSLTSSDPKHKILGCGDGPASFNAELTARGGRVVSVDPIYAFSVDQIRQRITETSAAILGQMKASAGAYVWDDIGSIDDLALRRHESMNRFLEDFPAGRRESRYVTAALPDLPFEGEAFDLALCSHFLFTYTDLLSLEFHAEAIAEMARVAREVRIFPLLTMDGRPSPHLQPVISALADTGLSPSVERVSYEFQRGGHSMLRVGKK